MSSQPAIIYADLPDAGAPPAQRARRSAVRRRMVNSAFSRRTMLKAFIAGGAAIGIGFLEMVSLPWKASAAPPTWGSCQAYEPYDTTSLWNICNPCAQRRPPISNFYCNNSGYHRKDTVHEGSGVVTKYRRRFSCGGGKNAWVWRIKNDFNRPNPRDRRCSDGRVRVERNGDVLSKHPTVCQKLLPKTGRVKDNRDPNDFCANPSG